MDSIKKFEIVSRILGLTISWHEREQKRYEFHPVIKEMLQKYEPSDVITLAYQWPHMSVKDSANVAYTRDDNSGNNDRQTVTTFGRYVRQFFPTLKDHEIRDYATKCQNDTYEIWDTPDAIVRSVIHGPKSCMTWDDNCYNPDHASYRPEHDPHPYLTYAPEFGWKSVVRLDPVSRLIKGRAIVYEKDEHKCFVRTYKRGPDYSYADEALEYWLRENGYKHEDAWPEGAQLKWLPPKYSYCEFLAPYIDGNTQTVNYNSADNSIYIEDGGSFECHNTDGSYDGAGYYCECCNNRSTDELNEVSDDYYSEVCNDCLHNEFTYARGRRYESYFRNEYVIETVDGDYYHQDYLDEHGIVELEDGDYASEEDCVRTLNGGYLLHRRVANDRSYVIINDCAYESDEVFYCNASEKYFPHDSYECVEVNGKTYYADYAPETTEQE